MSADLYGILGVSREASPQEVKKAYRRLALQYHPDQNDGDKAAEEKFKEISEAYSVLGDAQKRAQYDRFGTVGSNPFQGGNPFAGGGGQPFGGGNPFAGGVPFGGANDVFVDILNDLFGQRRRAGRAHRGSDLKYVLEITFEEAAQTTTKEIEIPKIEGCPVCEGSGARPGTRPVTCKGCNGTGQVRVQQGFFSISRPCGRCGASGEIIESPCRRCEGSGRVTNKEMLEVEVPAGVAEGQRLRWTGKGEPGVHGGPPGDLYVVISLAEHPFFERRDQDVLCKLPISFPQATLGCEVEVPTLTGKVRMKIPAGTQSGKTLRLRKKGFPRVDTRGSGDQLVNIKVETPTNLSSRQEELLREFAEISGENVQPESRGFLDRMKSFFS
jgi:molecular chaperone DnaJ